MPSLLSRFKHRKTPSSGSADLTPPSAPLTQQRLTRPNAPVVDRSVEDGVVVDQTLPPTRSHPYTGSRGAPSLITSNQSYDTAAPAPAPNRAGGDVTGHPPAFVDESGRLDLPTTSSDVNNPGLSGISSPTSKSLPKLPELPVDLSTPFNAFPLPPGAAPADSLSPPPMPHVTSADRSSITGTEMERPKPIMSASQALSQEDEEGVGGRFGHVQSVPATNNGSRSEGTARSRKSMDKSVPARGDSLANPPVAFPGSSRPTTPPSTPPMRPRESLKSVWDPNVNGEEFVNRHIASLSLDRNARIPYEPKSTAALESQRDEMVSEIAGSATSQRDTLSALGQRTFQAAGMADKLKLENTVDVQTQWMEPVVQETVRRVEHTETSLYIDRVVHKYHIYPKVQPIHDPDPILLETRHRIFSQADGQWHEVIGDAAAIEILGEEVFYRGRKQSRETRAMTMPGWDGVMKNMTDEDLLARGLGTGFGMGRVLEREGLLGGEMGEWHEVGKRTGTGSGTRRGIQIERDSKVGLAL